MLGASDWRMQSKAFKVHGRDATLFDLFQEARTAVLQDREQREVARARDMKHLLRNATQRQIDRLREEVSRYGQPLTPNGIIRATKIRIAREEGRIRSIAEGRGLSDEELDRLDAHVTAARALLAEDAPKGRKLDFLSQEFNREANTLCSKAGYAPLTRVGLDLKHTIDQMREQIQNVE